jgi:hypothetical protein
MEDEEGYQMKPLPKYQVILGDYNFLQSFDYLVDALKWVYENIEKFPRIGNGYRFAIVKNQVVLWEEGEDYEVYIEKR